MPFTYSCKDCTDRHLYCHDTCEKYKKDKEERAKMKDAGKADREYQQYYSNHMRKVLDFMAIKKRRLL